MICQNCLKNVATVHVTEIAPPVALENGSPAAPASAAHDATADASASADETSKLVQEQHLCEVCAQTMDLPHMPASKKTVADIWKLLQLSAQQTRKKGGQTCPSCGMTLDEFRKKGRLGCAKDYEVFGAHIGDLLERVHGARTHVGRIPGTSEADLERQKRLTDLRSQLDAAIRDEAYESAARLRDELKTLEGGDSDA
jgi:protein arginine kinase activator